MIEKPPNPRNLQITVSDAVSVAELISWLENAEMTDSDLIIGRAKVDDIERNFPFNSKLEQIQDRFNIDVYSTDETPLPTAVIDDKMVYYEVKIGETSQFVELPSEDVVSAFESEFDSLVASAPQISLDTPAWDTLLDQLEATVDVDTREEFERLIGAARIQDLGALDEVSVAIIAAAQSGALTYDLGKWAEEVGIASKATISRRKSGLEEDDIIYTEKVPVDVGRPRHRLQLADDISEVTVNDEELDVERDPLLTERTATTETSDGENPTDNEQAISANQDSVLATIEEEIKEVISSN